jgi:hypothetical protein
MWCGVTSNLDLPKCEVFLFFLQFAQVFLVLRDCANLFQTLLPKPTSVAAPPALGWTAAGSTLH